MRHIAKLPGMLFRLVTLPLFMLSMIPYHFVEVLFNGPNATGYWAKTKVYVIYGSGNSKIVYDEL